MHDWSQVSLGIYHNFHYRWIAAIMDRLNAGLLPRGMVAMAEQIIGGPEPDVVTLQQNEPFELPADRNLTLVAYQASPIKTAYVEPYAVGAMIPDMPLFLQNDFYINVPLETTYMDTWNVLPQSLRDLVR